MVIQEGTPESIFELADSKKLLRTSVKQHITKPENVSYLLDGNLVFRVQETSERAEVKLRSLLHCLFRSVGSEEEVLTECMLIWIALN